MYPVITIDGLCGVEGRETGKAVSELLGVHYFDKELLSLAAKESGINYHDAGDLDERPSVSFLYSIVTGKPSSVSGLYGRNVLSANDKLFVAQKNIILRIAEAPCVIVGRCADHILADRPELISVFMYAPLEYRALLFARKNGIPVSEAKNRIAASDKNKAAYYKYNTGKRWALSENYSLTFDASRLSDEAAASVIAEYVKRYIDEKGEQR